MRSWLHRRKATELNGSALKQVDRLLEGRPKRLDVPISALPGQHDDLLSTYGQLFRLRGYVLTEVEHDSPELWTATFERRRV